MTGYSRQRRKRARQGGRTTREGIRPVSLLKMSRSFWVESSVEETLRMDLVGSITVGEGRKHGVNI